jgi:archaellum component FlaG (FlaF/FlaG flagellin family)
VRATAWNTAVSLSAVGTLIMEAVGVLLGAAIAWALSWYYYKRAADDLRKEAKRLHMALSAVVYKMEHPDAVVEATRDADGAVTGLKVYVRATGVSASTATVNLTLSTSAPPSDKPAQP